MANAHKGETRMQVGAEEYTLKYDLNAMAEIQDRLEVTGMEAVLDELEKMDFKTIRMLLWAGVLHQFMDEHDNPTISERKVGAWDISMVQAAEYIAEALKKSMGVSDEQIEAANKVKDQAELAKVATAAKKTKPASNKKK